MTIDGRVAEATSSWPATSTPPSALYGDLFTEVQRRALFSDGKTFADAAPRRAPAEIMASWAAAGALDEAALRRFVEENFSFPRPFRHPGLVPGSTGPQVTRQEPPAAPPAARWTPEQVRGDGEGERRALRAHIAATWNRLARPPVVAAGSALALDHPHVVPGGRFREPYYWDGFFTLLGLARDRPVLADGLVDCLTDLIERHGHVPNGARSYYLSRSQPPVYALMPPLTPSGWTPRRRAALAAEYRFWMTGARAVRLPDGAMLNRYWDDADAPRDESWREDVGLAETCDRPPRALWRDLRAACESGWDFSSRWLGDGASLATIRTTRILPIDLNALLFVVERTLGLEAAAARRRAAIDRHLWQDGYHDRDLDRGPTGVVGAAALFPLFAGCASAAQAVTVAELVGRRLLAPGGLRTTLVETGQQWDAPNGWAPLQWIAIEGLRRYGFGDLAGRVAEAWLGTVSGHFAATGRMLEKYDVERGGAGGGGEYDVQDGFGWTNGVTAALLDERS